jgi:ferredoxin
MRIEIDPERCTGHGRCYSLAPDVFDADENGFSVVKESVVNGELCLAARRGADACPERAITLIG